MGKNFTYPIQISREPIEGKWTINISQGNNTQQQLDFIVKSDQQTKPIINETKMPEIETSIDQFQNTTLMSVTNIGNANVSSLIIRAKQGDIEEAYSNSQGWNVTITDNMSAVFSSNKPLDN
jgi:hypothetical protein